MSYNQEFFRRFQIKTLIEYFIEVQIDSKIKTQFYRDWKKKYQTLQEPGEESYGQRRFNRYLKRIQKTKNDQFYSNRISIRYIHANVGYGVFAKEDIPKYSILGHYTGVFRLDKEIPNHHDSTFMFDDFQKYSIDAKQAGNWTRFMNHAKEEEANVTAWEHYTEEGPVIMFTSRSKGIKRGEQLLYSYGSQYWQDKSFKQLKKRKV